MMRSFGVAVAVAVVALAVPAAAQFSDSYNFIKAVKDKDIGAARKILDTPGTTVVNVRDRDTDDTALHIVTRRADAGWLVFLLQAGANANVRDREGNSPLMLATQGRFAEGVRILVLVKAQIDLANRLGETPLLKAVQNRDPVVAKMLIDGGANPDLTDNTGTTARSFADNDPRSGAVARLLKDIPVRNARKVQGPSI